MSLYLKIPNIEGDVSTSSYKGWIELNSVDLNVERAVQTKTGQSDNRITGMPRFSEAEVSKNTDSASSSLFQNAYSGKVVPSVEIHWCDVQAQPRIKYIFSNVIFSKASHSLTKNTPGQELWTLNYRQVEVTHTGKDASGNQKSPRRVSYNLDTASST